MNIWKKTLAATAAGVLCLGGAGVPGMQNVLESIGAVLSVCATVPEAYSGIYDEKLYYNVTDAGEIEIVGCAADAITADIPETIDDKPVTSIAAKAFEGCLELQSVTMPDTIKKVGENAFFNCTQLKYGVNITDMDAWWNIAFGNFRGNPLSYGAPLYLNGRAVETVSVPYDVRVIGASTFAGCSSIRKVIMHSDVIGIENWAFWNCCDLTSVNIKDGVEFIGASAFSKCSLLKEIRIPNTLKKLESSVFADCTALTSITIPDSVTYISYAFTGCTGLTEVTIPSAVTVVENGAFGGCTNLKDVTVENYQANVEYNAFMNCQPNVHFTVPDTFDSTKESFSVGNHATHLTVQHQDSAIPANAYQEMTKLREVTLEDGITSIGESAFADCTELEKIVIPQGVTVISQTAFAADTKLTIYGYTGSYAETYAAKYEIPFVSLGIADIEPVPALEKGDVDGNGVLNATDVAQILTYVARSAVGMDTTLTDDQLTAADIDDSGEVDSKDAAYLLTYIAQDGAGMESSWETILGK